MHTGRPLLYFLLKIANDLMIMFQELPNVWVLRPRHAHCIDKNAKYSGHQGYFRIIGTEISRLVYLTI